MAKSKVISDTTEAMLLKFTANVYGAKDSVSTSLNGHRHQKFMQTYGPKGNGQKLLASLRGVDASELPPCEDEVIPHMKRACFVASMWATADQSHIDQHPTEENGWQLVDGRYKPIWFEGQLLPGRLIPEGDDLEEIEKEAEDDMEMASSDDEGSSEDDD